MLQVFDKLKSMNYEVRRLKNQEHGNAYKKGLIYIYLYIPNSIKVALGIGQSRIGKLLFGSHSSKAFHCVPYAQIHNAIYEITGQCK